MNRANHRNLILGLLVSIALIVMMMPQTASAKTVALGAFTEVDGNITYEYNDDSLLESEGTAEETDSTTNLPVKYNLAEKNLSTAVRNQGQYGTCWAFGAMASLESNMLIKGVCGNDINLSERHLAYFTYNGKSPSEYAKSVYAGSDTYRILNTGLSVYNQGGERSRAANTLQRRYGAVNEGTAPYKTSMGALNTSLKTKSTYKVGDIYYMPEVNDDSGRTNKSAITEIKKAIKKYGALSVGCYSEGFGKVSYRYYNKRTNASYCDRSRNANHEVTIVGWNDNYSKDNFGGTAGAKPKKNGAWIIKNSWGSKHDRNGYFYLSYYDKAYSQATAYTVINGLDKYYRTYQYDGTGYGDNYLMQTGLIKGANRYTARHNEKLAAYRIETPVADTIVQIKVYRSSSKTVPTKGRLIYSCSRKFKYAGYNTVKFKNALKISKGKHFTVVVTEKFDNNGTYSYIIPFELKYNSQKVDSDFCQVKLAPLSKGESFVYRSGKWYDVSDKTQLKKAVGTYFLSDKTIGNAVGKVLTVR